MIRGVMPRELARLMIGPEGTRVLLPSFHPSVPRLLPVTKLPLAVSLRR
jgi:hypothetical protein